MVAGEHGRGQSHLHDATRLMLISDIVAVSCKSTLYMLQAASSSTSPPPLNCSAPVDHVAIHPLPRFNSTQPLKTLPSLAMAKSTKTPMYAALPLHGFNDANSHHRLCLDRLRRRGKRRTLGLVARLRLEPLVDNLLLARRRARFKHHLPRVGLDDEERV